MFFLANRRIIFEMCNHTELAGKPFDIVLDKAGYIWIGLLHGGSVRIPVYEQKIESFCNNLIL